MIERVKEWNEAGIEQALLCGESVVQTTKGGSNQVRLGHRGMREEEGGGVGRVGK